MRALVHERFTWTRLDSVLDWLEVEEAPPVFAAFALSAPAAAAFLFLSLGFYLLIVWLDYK